MMRADLHVDIGCTDCGQFDESSYAAVRLGIASGLSHPTASSIASGTTSPRDCPSTGILLQCCAVVHSTESHTDDRCMIRHIYNVRNYCVQVHIPKTAVYYGRLSRPYRTKKSVGRYVSKYLTINIKQSKL